MSDSSSESYSEASEVGASCTKGCDSQSASDMQNKASKEKESQQGCSSSKIPPRRPPPPVPSKPPRVYALAKGTRSRSETPKSSKSNSDEDSSEQSYKSVASSHSIPCNDKVVSAQPNVASACGGDVEVETVDEAIHLNEQLSTKVQENKAELDNFVTHAEEHGSALDIQKSNESPTEKDKSSSTYKMKNVEIFISDADHLQMENDDEERNEMMIAEDNLIPLIINDILPNRSRNNSPNVAIKKPCGNMIEDGNEDETCVTGCSWEMDDDDDGTDCSSSCGMDRVPLDGINTLYGGICGARGGEDPLSPTTRRKATVGCSIASANADSKIKEQIVVVKLAAKVVQCPSASPSSTISVSPRPPPPPPPIPSYPESSTPSDSSSASNPHEKANTRGIHNKSIYYNDDDDPGKDGNEPGVEESSTSDLYQNMVVAHGLMIEREMGEDMETLVQKVVKKHHMQNKNRHSHQLSLPVRPLTQGKGIDDFSDEEDEEDGHCYQNIIVKQGKFSVSTKKSNTKSSCDPSVQSVPFMDQLNKVTGKNSCGDRDCKRFSTRIMELETPSSDALVPVVHAVINLPPRKASLIKERRRTRMENLSYQKASRINQLMLAEFKAGGNDRPTSVSLMRDGKVMSVTSNNCSDLANSDGSAAEPGSIIGKVKIGFGLNKAKTSLQKSKSAMTSQVEKARRKMGSWYQRRVKTPVEQMGAEFGMSRSNSRQAGESRLDVATLDSVAAGSEYSGSVGLPGKSHDRRSCTPADFVDSEEQLSQNGEDDTDGPAYSNVVYAGKCQSVDLESRDDTETVFDRDESDDDNSFRTKVNCLKAFI